jgi:hypothetical protein
MSSPDTRFDDVFAAVAAQHPNLGGFLGALFSWLHRRSDLYVADPSPARPMGFAPGEAEALVLRAFRAFPYKAPPGSLSAAARGAAPAAPPPQPAPGAAGASVRRTAEGKQVPVANGGVGPGYCWEQTLGTVTLLVALPAGTTSKGVECAVKERWLRLALRGAAAPILDAPLAAAVRAGDASWGLASPDATRGLLVDEARGAHAPPEGCGLAAGAAGSSRLFTLCLEKAVATWWRSFTEGGPEIDATLVDSTQPLSDYDEETQAAIRKLVTEQTLKQQQQGFGGGGGGGGGPPP